VIVTYTTPRHVAKLSVPDRHDWAVAADWIATQMGLKVAKDDAVFEEIMLARQYEKAKKFNQRGKK